MRITTTLLILMSVVITSCSVEQDKIYPNEQNITENPITRDFGIPPIGGIDDGVNNDDPVLCTQADLIAGQNQTIGVVSVYTDGTTVTVCYDTFAGWTLDMTHLYIGDCAERPANNPGNPMIGQFPYSMEHPGETSVCYEIDQSTLPSGVICVAAHAEAEGTTSETAWACCEPYGGANWAMYFEVDLSACVL